MCKWFSHFTCVGRFHPHFLYLEATKMKDRDKSVVWFGCGNTGATNGWIQP